MFCLIYVMAGQKVKYSRAYNRYVERKKKEKKRKEKKRKEKKKRKKEMKRKERKKETALG